METRVYAHPSLQNGAVQLVFRASYFLDAPTATLCCKLPEIARRAQIRDSRLFFVGSLQRPDHRNHSITIVLVQVRSAGQTQSLLEQVL